MHRAQSLLTESQWAIFDYIVWWMCGAFFVIFSVAGHISVWPFDTHRNAENKNMFIITDNNIQNTHKKVCCVIRNRKATNNNMVDRLLVVCIIGNDERVFL